MNFNLNNILPSIYKFSFRSKFAIFLIFFSLAMAGLIYWKEVSSRDDIIFFKVIFWQLIIWIPWYFSVPLMKYILKLIDKYKSVKKSLALISAFIFIVSLHGLWFFFYSSLFSPYLGMANECFGVFPYFFIFWTLIDFILLFALHSQLSSSKDKNEDSINKIVSIQVKRGNKKMILKSDSVLWISADGYYICLYTEEGQFLLRRTLKDLIKSLPETTFIKIHRSAIINIDYLSELQKSKNGGIIVLMKDGRTHPVSRTYIKPLKNTLKNLSA